jgi:hypothetical protein
MRTVLVILAVVAMATTAFATSARVSLQQDEVTVDLQHHGAPLAVADVLICIDINANPGFADLSMRYADAFTFAGATTFAFASVEIEDGTINFPSDVTADNYPVVVVLTSENWWDVPGNIDPADEAVLASYLDTGGNLLFVGQDYMWGSHPEMGPCSGFPYDYLGMNVCSQDVIWAPDTANVSGSTGGLFDGESFFLDSTLVFLNNPFFPDVATPTATANYLLYYDEAALDGVAIYNETETFKTVWAGIEISAAPDMDFNHMIETIYDWFLSSTPVEETTWGSIKADYR